MTAIHAVVALACAVISKADAERLVLLAPEVLARGPDVAAEYKRVEYGEWVFRVRTTTPGKPSRLVGWYAVEQLTYVVRNWVADGLPVMTGPELRRAEADLRRSQCPTRGNHPG